MISRACAAAAAWLRSFRRPHFIEGQEGRAHAGRHGGCGRFGGRTSLRVVKERLVVRRVGQIGCGRFGGRTSLRDGRAAVVACIAGRLRSFRRPHFIEGPMAAGLPRSAGTQLRSFRRPHFIEGLEPALRRNLVEGCGRFGGRTSLRALAFTAGDDPVVGCGRFGGRTSLRARCLRGRAAALHVAVVSAAALH